MIPSRKRANSCNVDETTCAKSSKKSDGSSKVWTLEDRCRLVQAMNDEKMRRFPMLVRKYVGKKPIKEVINYMNHLLDQSKIDPEFEGKAALDVWVKLMEKVTMQGDTTAALCIPQLMTVAAFEPTNTDGGSENLSPNYSNVYNYLALMLKGNEPVDIPPADAQVVLQLLDDLTNKLSDSHTMLQKEFLNEAFGALSKKNAGTDNERTIPNDALQNAAQTDNLKQSLKSLPSLNPLNVPLGILEFKKKAPLFFDFSTDNWRTTFS